MKPFITAIILFTLACGLSLGQGDATPVETSDSAPDQSQAPRELASPRATMRTFLTAMVDVKQGDIAAYAKAIACLDLSDVDPFVRDAVGKQAAEDLSICIDRIKYVVFEDIPKDHQGVWTFVRTPYRFRGSSHTGVIEIAESDDGAWRFTPRTLVSVGTYSDYLFENPVVEGVVELETWRTRLAKRFPWLNREVFLLVNWQWIVLIAIIFLGLVAERIVSFAVRKVVEHWLRQKQHFDIKDETALRLPFRLISYAIVFYIGIQFMQLETPILQTLMRIALVVLAVGMVWAAMNIINVVANYFGRVAEHSENKLDDLLVPLLHKGARVLVMVVGVLFVAQAMGSDLAALLTGLGIGGLAVALAAKDTIANLFGSLTVLLDRPFQIGDWIVMGSVEGTVEAVGFRSTRIRTFYDSLISVPNSNLTNTEIDNFGRRKYRRFSTKIGITYDTPPDRVEAFCEGIRQLILAHKRTRKDYFHVYLNSYGPSSLEILLYVFWFVPDWSTELSERHRLLIDILRLGRKLNVEFAFPTQTVHLYQEEATQRPELGDAVAFSQSAAQGIIAEPMTSADPRSGTSGARLPEHTPGL